MFSLCKTTHSKKGGVYLYFGRNFFSLGVDPIRKASHFNLECHNIGWV